MAYAVQPIKQNILSYQRSLNQPQSGFKQWLSEQDASNDDEVLETSFETLTRPRTSLEDFLFLAQTQDLAVNNSFAPHAETLNPYQARALPSDIESNGQYVFEFLVAAPMPGEKINRKI